MPEVDIDKMLEKQERAEKEKKQKEMIQKGLIIGGASAAGIILIIILVFAMLGEKSSEYFPMTNNGKFVFNIKNKSPEVWQFKDNTVQAGGFECSVLNRTEKANYFSKQEYYMQDKKGIMKVGVSKDFGRIKDEKLRILPARMKEGAEFDAGTVKNVQVVGTITRKEEVSTAVGDCVAYVVEYKGGENVDMEVWYAKGVGVIRMTDRVLGDQLDLIGREEK